MGRHRSQAEVRVIYTACFKSADGGSTFTSVKDKDGKITSVGSYTGSIGKYETIYARTDTAAVRKAKRRARELKTFLDYVEKSVERSVKIFEGPRAEKVIETPTEVTTETKFLKRISRK